MSPFKIGGVTIVGKASYMPLASGAMAQKQFASAMEAQNKKWSESHLDDPLWITVGKSRTPALDLRIFADQESLKRKKELDFDQAFDAITKTTVDGAPESINKTIGDVINAINTKMGLPLIETEAPRKNFVETLTQSSAPSAQSTASVQFQDKKDQEFEEAMRKFGIPEEQIPRAMKISKDLISRDEQLKSLRSL